jgi:cytochrome c peroxidase
MLFIASRLRSRPEAWGPVGSANTLRSRKNERWLACIAVGALLCAIAGSASAAPKSANSDNVAEQAWQKGAIDHAQKMRKFRDVDSGTQATPPVIPESEADFDPSGTIATYQPNGATQTSANAFFQNLGTNERTCFTCHQPQNGWSVSAAGVQARFYASFGSDPIFRLVDGATCPTDDVSSVDDKLQAYSLLLSKGLIRIGLPMPAGAQFEITSVNDPYNCNTNATTGLTSPTSGIVSVYRRPLPSTNLNFLTAIMWDGREPTFLSQATDATLGHAQGNAAPTDVQVQQIVQFETGLYTAQISDNKAKDLYKKGSDGGPETLWVQYPSYYPGINDPFGQNPKGNAFNSNIFDLFGAWADLPGKGGVSADRQSIARGEAIFNTTPINISGVAGINDALQQPNFSGFCGTCHDTPNVGNHSVKAPLNIGIADAGANAPPALDVSDLPVFTLQCTAGPLSGQTFTVTDPGRALISGNCADIGKMKGPILRGLAARAPYFHNGSAATLLDVVNFYDQRFSIGFSEQDKRDLVAFLQSL